ncbi:hypothetical protein ACKKBG_A21505 [Auxenochlorella protothecoides x Auxenochlorella symbiontica]
MECHLAMQRAPEVTGSCSTCIIAHRGLQSRASGQPWQHGRSLFTSGGSWSPSTSERPRQPPGREQQPEWLDLLPTTPGTKVVLYKGPGMLLFRILVRFKVAQMCGVGATGALLATLLRQAESTTMQTLAAGGLLFGASATSGALWYFSRRYVGELAMLPPSAGNMPPRLLFSTMDFWGNREDRAVDLGRLLLPHHGSWLGGGEAALLPLDVEGDRQYYISLPYGHVISAQLLKGLLRGEMHARLAPMPDGTWGWEGGAEALQEPCAHA